MSLVFAVGKRHSRGTWDLFGRLSYLSRWDLQCLRSVPGRQRLIVMAIKIEIALDVAVKCLRWKFLCYWERSFEGKASLL